MKRIFTLFLCCAAAMTGLQAIAATYKSMVFEGNDSKLTLVNMEDGMTATIADGLMTLSCDKGEIYFNLAELRNWTFSAQEGSSDLWAGIEAPATDAVTISWSGDVITIQGLPEGSAVSLTAIDGRTVRSLRAGESCSIPTSGLSAGVYVLTYNNKSIKVALGR